MSGCHRLALALALVAAVGCGDAASPAGPSDAATLDAPAAVDAAIDADVNGPAAFRISDLALHAPHLYVNVALQGCTDVTDDPVMQTSVNGLIKARMETDADADGALDESIVTVFRPLAQAAATNPLELHRPRCSAPLASTTCQANPASAPPVVTTAHNLIDVTCLTPAPGTYRAYMPPIVHPLSPCYRSDPAPLTIDLAGVALPLHDARIAATYFDDPAQGTNDGLLMGFVTVADARAATLPATIPVIGGRTLESLLPGGNGACPGFSDQHTNGADSGWWLYLNFRAPRVPWTDN